MMTIEFTDARGILAHTLIATLPLRHDLFNGVAIDKGSWVNYIKIGILSSYFCMLQNLTNLNVRMT